MKYRILDSFLLPGAAGAPHRVCQPGDPPLELTKQGAKALLEAGVIAAPDRPDRTARATRTSIHPEA